MKKIIWCFIIICVVLGLTGCKDGLIVTEITDNLASSEYLKTQMVFSTYSEDNTLKDRFLEGIKDIATSELYEKNHQIQSSYINYGDYVIVIGDGSYDEKEDRIEQSKKLYIMDKNKNICLLKEFDKEIYQISIKDKTKIICIVELTKNDTYRTYIEYDLFTGEEKILAENTKELYFYHNNTLYNRDKSSMLYEIGEDKTKRKLLYSNIDWAYRDGNDIMIIPTEKSCIIKNGNEIQVTDEAFLMIDNDTILTVNNRLKNLDENKITVLNFKEDMEIRRVLGKYGIALSYSAKEYQYYLIDLNNGDKYRFKEQLVIDNYDYRYEADVFMFDSVIYFYDLTKDSENVSSQYSKFMALDLSQLEKVK